MSEQLRPVKRALVSVYDKRGLDVLAPALIAAGVEVVSTGSTAQGARRCGRLGHPGERGDRLPRVPRRPGQDAAPGRARRAARRPVASRRTSSSWTSSAIAPFELVIVNLYPFARDRCFGRRTGRVRRADRHRRARDDPRRGQEHRERRRRRRPRRATPTSSRRWRRAASTLPSRLRLAARSVRPHRELRRGRGLLAGPRTSCRPTTRDSRDGSAAPGPARECCATARTRTSGQRSMPAWRGRASPRPTSSTARRCPTTTTSTRTRPGGRPTTLRAVRGDHQAREPVRHRDRRRPTTRWPRRTARPTPATR